MAEGYRPIPLTCMNVCMDGWMDTLQNHATYIMQAHSSTHRKTKYTYHTHGFQIGFTWFKN